MAEHTRPDDKTREAGAADAEAAHDADRMPTSDEERRADELSVDPDVAESYKDAAERGADQEGEGRI